MAEDGTREDYRWLGNLDGVRNQDGMKIARPGFRPRLIEDTGVKKDGERNYLKKSFKHCNIEPLWITRKRREKARLQTTTTPGRSRSKSLETT